MGVQGLWELLAPVGRRVSVETLAGRKLAIDASIWMIQFMKAMRDEKGEMVRNAHLIGFFRRICKLLFLRTKPVFVFDGGTPALKRRTVIARRRQRENAQAKIRKTAEKLLLNHLKARKLEELARDIKNQKERNDLKGKKVVSDADDVTENAPGRNEDLAGPNTQESIDEMLAASLAAEENEKFAGNTSSTVGGAPSDEEDGGDENEEMILPSYIKKEWHPISAEGFCNQGQDTDHPLMSNNIDPTVLAALPPSMQLDLLVQMRERLMAENRHKFQKVKKAPTKFSELQIQSYLKTIAFRREIDEVQKSATGRGVGGVQTSRIASEANREFIFSSSFTGDKQTLTTAEVEKNRVLEHHTQAKQTIPSELLSCISSTSQFNSVTGESNNGLEKDSEHDVETYIDERGRVRVSRLRGLGFRMTRDLQRNLDLMKEFEQEKRKKSTVVGDDNDIHGATEIPENNHPVEVLSGDDGNVETNNIIEVDKKVAQSENSDLHQPSKAMEVSFLEDDFGPKSPDDDIFVRLVAGSSMSNFSSESVQHSCDSTPSFALDGRSSKGKNGSLDDDIEGSQPSLVDNNNSFEGEVDWEEGVCDVPGNASPLPIEEDITVSRGFLEEEADIQEAIRRSLEEFTTRQTVSSGKEDLDIADMEKTTVLSLEVPAFENNVVDFSHIQPSNVRQGEASCKKVDGNQRFNNVYQGDTLQVNDSLDKESATSGRIGVNAREGYEDSALRILNHEVNENGSICAAISYSDQITDLKPLEVPATGQVKCLGSSNEAEKGASATGGADGPIKIGSQNPEAETSDLDVILKNVHQSGSQAYHLNHFSDITNKNYGFYEGALKDQPIDKDKIACHDNLELQLEASQANLDEEMRLLREERLDLGDEQKKLERNAESVSSEMFAECQELLQMFGLPYIIAPMEAEAQCAYMELMNLVDGVVTDDSDVFLFGARSVYKNIFDDRKYVETYFMKDIETELGLSREKLIRMALLLGSDYTEGVSGIGIVNAIEVVNAFPEEDGLQKFREWLESPDPAILGKLAAHTGNSSRKKRSKVSSSNHDDGSTNNMDGSASEESIFRNDDDQQAANGLTDIKQNFMDKHRNVSKNWHIPSSFPSESVISAYTSPQVDKSTEPFSWGKPDLFVLRKLCWERFGWNNQKADELLIPVLKEYDKHETQLRLEAFYTFNERFAKIRSKRIKKAVKGITGNRASELVEDRELECSESKEERTARPSETEADRSESPSNGMNDGISEVESRASGKIAPKQQRKRKTQSEMRRSTVQREGKPNVSRDCVNTRGRGRGRVGRGGRKEVHICESTETSSSDGDDGNNGIQIENTKGLSRVRTSARPRKQVNYAANDMNDDSISSSPNQSEGNCSDPLEQDPSSDQGVVGDACAPIDEKHESEPPLEMNSTTDYLFGGGGFCIDEDDNQNGNPTPQVLNPTRVSEDLFNAEKIDTPKAGWISIGTHALDNDDSPSISEHPRENMTSCSQVIEERESLTEPAVSAGLSAMPALRRKRKKT